MLGIGMGEMIIIAIIALVVIGPEKFPDFAKIALRTMRDLRGYVDEIQGEVTKELKPIKREIDKISRESQSYIDKLSKETDKAINTPLTPAAPAAPAAPSPAPAASQADPTDRQDDGRGVSDPYGLNTAAPEPAGETAETKEAQETGQGEGAAPDAGDGAHDGFDQMEPPVERLD